MATSAPGVLIWIHEDKIAYDYDFIQSHEWVCVHRQMEAQAEEQAGEAQKERKLRERNEQYSRQLEEELEGLKVNLQTHTAENWYKVVGIIWLLMNR